MESRYRIEREYSGSYHISPENLKVFSDALIIAGERECEIEAALSNKDRGSYKGIDNFLSEDMLMYASVERLSISSGQYLQLQGGEIKFYKTSGTGYCDLQVSGSKDVCLKVLSMVERELTRVTTEYALIYKSRSMVFSMIASIIFLIVSVILILFSAAWVINTLGLQMNSLSVNATAVILICIYLILLHYAFRMTSRYFPILVVKVGAGKEQLETAKRKRSRFYSFWISLIVVPIALSLLQNRISALFH